MLLDRVCSECGSTLVQKHYDYDEPHCFVCAFGHPEYSQSLGLVEELLPKFNFNPAHYGMRSVILPPSVLFDNGVAYHTFSLIAGHPGGPVEDRRESIDIRDRARESSRAEAFKRLKRAAKKVLRRASEELLLGGKGVRARQARYRKARKRVRAGLRGRVSGSSGGKRNPHDEGASG